MEEILERDSFESIVNYLKSDLPEKVVSETDDICSRALNMDIKQQLNLYEVEYQLLNEEMIGIRQNKEKYDKQERALKDTQTQLANVKNELELTKNTVKSLQNSLDESNRRNCEYEKIIKMLQLENENLQSINKNIDVVSDQSKHTVSNENDSNSCINLVSSLSKVGTERMQRGMSTDSSTGSSDLILWD